MAHSNTGVIRFDDGNMAARISVTRRGMAQRFWYVITRLDIPRASGGVVRRADRRPPHSVHSDFALVRAQGRPLRTESGEERISGLRAAQTEPRYRNASRLATMGARSVYASQLP